MIKRILLALVAMSLFWACDKHAEKRIELLNDSQQVIALENYQQIGSMWYEQHAGIAPEFTFSKDDLRAFASMRDKQSALTTIIGQPSIEYPNFKCRFLLQTNMPLQDTLSLWLTTYTNQWQPIEAILVANLASGITNQYFVSINEDEGILLDQYIDGYNTEYHYLLDSIGKFALLKTNKIALEDKVLDLELPTIGLTFDIETCFGLGLVEEHPLDEKWTTISLEKRSTAVHTTQKYSYTGSEEDREWEEMFAPATGLDIPKDTFFDLAVEGEHSIRFHSFAVANEQPRMGEMKGLARTVYNFNNQTEDILYFKQGMKFKHQGTNYLFICLENVLDKELEEDDHYRRVFYVGVTENGKSYSVLTSDCAPKLNLLEIDGKMFLVIQEYSCHEGAYGLTTLYQLVNGTLQKVYQNGVSCD